MSVSVVPLFCIRSKFCIWLPRVLVFFEEVLVI